MFAFSSIKEVVYKEGQMLEKCLRFSYLFDVGLEERNWEQNKESCKLEHLNNLIDHYAVNQGILCKVFQVKDQS